MLTTLRIRNLALVEDLTLDLRPGYNVITGETGAGKSILIGALSLVLGERADRTLIRSGADSCSVEAVFEISNLGASFKTLLDENGLEPCEEDQLVLKRSFSSAGANRQFINGSPATLATLSAVGEWLVDIHGPHEHQSLLHPSRQLALLDAFGKLECDRAAFAALLARRSTIEAQKAALIVDERTYAQQLDLLRFQVDEITAARLQPNEDELLSSEYSRASNSAKLLQLSQTALDLLAENDSALLTQAGALGRALHEVQRIDPSAAALIATHEQATATLRELQSAISHYLDRIDADPARLQELEERLNLIQSLKRKYGGTAAEILAFGEEASAKLQGLENREAELARLNATLAKLETEIQQAGAALTAKRRKLIPQLSKAVTKQLSDLGFRECRFDIALESLVPASAGVSTASSPNSSGFDTIEFQFAPNPGEPARSLRAIASSGELARVMLAIKTVLAEEDRIPVLVFDEVDANVGGETAKAVGEKMRRIARNRQVLCITHLPQVAAPASVHFVAAKHVRAGRTISEINLLDQKARVTELARMLGGQTDAARKHAEAMLA